MELTFQKAIVAVCGHCFNADNDKLNATNNLLNN